MAYAYFYLYIPLGHGQQPMMLMLSTARWLHIFNPGSGGESAGSLQIWPAPTRIEQQFGAGCRTLFRPFWINSLLWPNMVEWRY
jgi:hypothetical protein